MAKLALLAGERANGESYRAIQGCNDWLRMGAGRSLAELAGRYTRSDQESPPTRSLGTLKRWSSRYGWAERAVEYDAGVEEQKNARRDAIMRSGLAQDHERVVMLRRLAALLEGELLHVEPDGSMPALWLPDVKQIGGGEHAERVDIVRFNRSMVEALRGLLDDLAKETGGRTHRLDMTTSGQSLGQALEDAIGRVYGGGNGPSGDSDGDEAEDAE